MTRGAAIQILKAHGWETHDTIITANRRAYWVIATPSAAATLSTDEMIGVFQLAGASLERSTMYNRRLYILIDDP